MAAKGQLLRSNRIRNRRSFTSRLTISLVSRQLPIILFEIRILCIAKCIEI